jgi:hypothetical protein
MATHDSDPLGRPEIKRPTPASPDPGLDQLLGEPGSGFDLCGYIKGSETFDPAAADAIRKALIDAIQKNAFQLEDKKKRCCIIGKEGLWIRLPDDVLNALHALALSEYNKTRKGTPLPDIGFTIMP